MIFTKTLYFKYSLRGFAFGIAMLCSWNARAVSKITESQNMEIRVQGLLLPLVYITYGVETIYHLSPQLALKLQWEYYDDASFKTYQSARAGGVLRVKTPDLAWTTIESFSFAASLGNGHLDSTYDYGTPRSWNGPVAHFEISSDMVSAGPFTVSLKYLNYGTLLTKSKFISYIPGIQIGLQF
ncbi:MAG: hypothetical protein HRU19_28215 [Pseudobacteriovorax sp.]|nr:hypothetical protein [Pseudobacteriovorax sp.]